MHENFDVVCAGIVVIDHIAAPIDQIPDAGRLSLTDDCFLTIGGCASNVAVDLRKMGVRTTLCGCVGDDMFGAFARQVLDAHGVDTAGLVTAAGVASSQTLIVNVRGQDRRFIHHVGASKVFSARHFPIDRIEKAKVLYVGGYFLMDALDPHELGAIFEHARKKGVATVLDVVVAGPDPMERLIPVLPHTDVFLPNEDEGKLITGEADPVRQAEIFHRAGAKTAVITCGGKGSILISETLRLRAGAFCVPFVDGTGGGDAFDAGYICGLLEGAPPERCLRIGSALGASCVTKSGATSGVFTKEQADSFLQQNNLSIQPLQ